MGMIVGKAGAFLDTAVKSNSCNSCNFDPRNLCDDVIHHQFFVKRSERRKKKQLTNKFTE